jgi:hypothetical protein
MTIVVFASIALKWVLDEPGSDAAEALLEKDLAAPSRYVCSTPHRPCGAERSARS